METSFALHFCIVDRKQAYYFEARNELTYKPSPERKEQTGNSFFRICEQIKATLFSVISLRMKKCTCLQRPGISIVKTAQLKGFQITVDTA